MPKDPRADADTRTDPAVWVDKHGDALFRYALLRVRDSDLAEEMVQECFLAALDARKRFDARSSERTWLIGILKRKIVDHLRRVSRQRKAEPAPEPAAGGEPTFNPRGFWRLHPNAWKADPAQLLEDREFWDVFRRCLEKLPGRLAETFLLREVEQMGSEEICEVLDLSPTNVWARLHRARLGLRRCLETNWFVPPKAGG